MLSQLSVRVPAALTAQSNPVRTGSDQGQALDTRAAFVSPPVRDDASYLDGWNTAVRYYRFFFLAPLYLALAVFLVTIREFRFCGWRSLCLAIQPGRQFLPGIPTALHRRCDVPFRAGERQGLERIGGAAARLIVFLCVAHFLFWYGPASIRRCGGLPVDRLTRPGRHQPRESGTADLCQPAACPDTSKLLVFVRILPQHIFQDEWVYNAADIDGARVVWARDLGEAEDEKLRSLLSRPLGAACLERTSARRG